MSLLNTFSMSEQSPFFPQHFRAVFRVSKNPFFSDLKKREKIITLRKTTSSGHREYFEGLHIQIWAMSVPNSAKIIVNFKCLFEQKPRESCYFDCQNANLKHMRHRNCLYFSYYSTFSNSFFWVDVDSVAKVNILE